MTLLRLRASLGEIVMGALLIVIGAVWAIGAGDYGLLGEGGRLAPGTLPFVCGTALSATGVFITGKTLFGARSGSTSTTEIEQSEAATAVESGAVHTAPDLGSSVEATSTAPEQRRSIVAAIRAMPSTYPVATVLLFLAGGLLLMPLLGFSISFALIIFAILRFVERQSLRTSLLVGVITSLFGFLLFEVLFNLPLPEPFFL